MNKKIIKINFNWFYTEDGEGYEEHTVGEYNVLSIEEHEPRGEGDKWFYDITFVDGHKERIFNPNKVVYE